jgi:uroporphyrinogen decarboxylase
MTSKERVLNCLARKGMDRLPVRHEAEPPVNRELMEHAGLSTEGLSRAWADSRTGLYPLLDWLGDDFRYVEPEYIGPELKAYEDETQEGIWGERYRMVNYGAGEYSEATVLPFAGVTDPARLDDFRWPSADWYDTASVKSQAEALKDYAVVAGNAGFMDLINGTARTRGVEQVLMDIAMEDPVYLDIIDRRCEFFYEHTRRILEAADGTVDIMHMGEDWGAQNGALISPQCYRKLFMPRYKRYVDMIHGFGVKAMIHICGSVRKLLPDIIETGFDIYDVVQVSAEGMGIEGLKKDFGDAIVFAGTVCVQTTLPSGTVDDVKREVALRRELFHKGGLILGPTHAIQANTPVENILTMYREAGSLTQE